MIEDLPLVERDWLARFFASPNELSWSSLMDGSARPQEADQVRRWLSLFVRAQRDTPLILPFVRGNGVAGWYATTKGNSGGYELLEEINAWLGPTWLSFLDRVPVATKDPMAVAVFERFGGTVYRFKGADQQSISAISARLNEIADVLARRPTESKASVRPVGAIRGDFERALIVGDASQAEVMLGELRKTGRLNEENLRFLEVRLSAGLGFWSEIARDHWRIKTMSDLALPSQVISDLIEALYRTYIDPVEATGNCAAVLEAFAHNIVDAYPKLFASRRGIRSPRVLKSFIFYELLQKNPTTEIIDELVKLLPADSSALVFQSLIYPHLPPPVATTLSEADQAFDDGQFDRALEFYSRLPQTRKTVSRLVFCVELVGTSDATERLFAVLQNVEPSLFSNLASPVLTKIENLRSERRSKELSTVAPESKDVSPWMQWALQLQSTIHLSVAEIDVLSAPTNWDATQIRNDAQLAKKFADIIGGLNSEASAIARAAVPQIITSFFPDEIELPPTSKPIAFLLFILIAVDDALSRTDLDLLAQLTVILVKQGLSADEYVALIGDLKDVQKRVGSYAYLSWSLDLCESLAILPCPTDVAHDARLGLFLQVLGQATRFSHRLTLVDLQPLGMLAQDFGESADVVASLKRSSKSMEFEHQEKTDLKGKTIGIYTLAGSAGARAKIALETLFPGCTVAVNSDTVATAQLTSLAKTADIFVFAWKSSSHQAFYCVKAARLEDDLIWAPGKGTASILRAVLDRVA